MSSHNLRIVIDGNIGSGKTTQLKLLSEMGFTVQCEPIDEWPLEQFYEDKHRWAFLLQMSILRSFVKYGKSSDVWERSPESSKDVFWKMLRSEGIGTDDENIVYNFFYEQNAWKPDVHVYIQTDPDECFRRLSNRYQPGDSTISREYLQKVHTFYEDYINQSSVNIIDGNQPPEKIHEDIKNAITMFRSHKKWDQM
jgi:deoxyadenosine/deoxycytidine kinase